jgi:uracil-DNA glycosylase family 4
VDAELRNEAARVLADARAALAELIEEGVDGWETLAEPVKKAETVKTAEPTRPAASSEAPAALIPPSPPASSPASTPGAPRVEAQAESAPAWGPEPSLESVREHLGECRRCDLCDGRNSIVFGDGNSDADLMFIGEGPGEQEDRRGLPFVGRAGDLLTQMIEKGLGIPRSSVYICNIVKCRPPQNRTPLPPEVSACRPFLDGQIDAVRPKVIVTLGKPAASLLLGRDVAITRVRGTWQEYRGIPLMPTLHPAFVLRQYTAENRRNVWEDLKAALTRSQELGADSV